MGREREMYFTVNGKDLNLYDHSDLWQPQLDAVVRYSNERRKYMRSHSR